MSDQEYCPPCEQVWWWRIICDESHCLKNTDSKYFRACESLGAAHKWGVTGTPVNTSLNDLKGQLKMIGLEDVGPMFNVFQNDMAVHFSNNRKRRYHDRDIKAGNFLFTMRNILIRHSLKQQGTLSNTYIMSLPPKEEIVINIPFAKTERRQYEKLEADAQTYYKNIKGGGVDIGKQYLKLKSALIPLRVACSGGFMDKKLDKSDNPELKSKDPTLKVKVKVKDESIADIAFKSKFHKLLQELKRIRTDEPTSKSLVFSQFKSTLSWMKQELPKHGFQFKTISGDMTMTQRAKALREFQHDPPTTVFLLSIRAGAVGINLTQANYVFIMEPATNPALEAQAIGRIYRLGQRKSVRVIKLYIENSIETRLVGVLKKKYGKKTDSALDKEAETGTTDDETVHGNENDCKSMNLPVVGHIQQDNADLLEEEFDMLFGIKT